jgi:hypothetical protein
VGIAWAVFWQGAEPRSAAPAPAASLEVQVSRAGRSLSLHEALPLRTADDRIRVVARAPAGLDSALYSVSPRARPVRLDAERSPADRFTRWVYPAGGGVVPFDPGPGGTEVLIFCAGPRGGSAQDDLAPLIASILGELPALPADTVVTVDRDEPRQARGKGSPLGPRQSDAVADVEFRLDRLRQRLRDRFAVVLAVAFAHRQ